MVNGTFPIRTQVGKICRANMVNKTFLPPAPRPRKTPNPFKIQHFRNWHGFR
jgi:hypothetical protein